MFFGNQVGNERNREYLENQIGESKSSTRRKQEKILEIKVFQCLVRVHYNFETTDLRNSCKSMNHISDCIEEKFKLERAQGECLGIGSRRRT